MPNTKKLCEFIASLLCTNAIIEKLFSLNNNFWTPETHVSSEKITDLPILLGEKNNTYFFKNQTQVFTKFFKILQSS